MPAIRDMEYAALVGRERPLIQAMAYLLTGDPVQAERVVQLVFARLYERRHGIRDSRLEAIRTLVQTAHAPVHLPWEHFERFELIDEPRPPAAEGIIADLSVLSYGQRVTVVLECYAGLSTAQIADVLRLPVGDVPSVARRARNMLTAGDPGRTTDEALAEELAAAVPYDMRESRGSTDDLAHGRRLARRRWVQRGSVALVAVVLLVLAAVALVPVGGYPPRPPVPQAAPPPPITTPPRATCEPSDVTCRAYILFEWRANMVEVASSYLDPTGEYFSGFGFSYNSRYDTPNLWTAQGGALAFEMFRRVEGATEVYLQIATDRKFAIRCGATTRQECMFIRFMDGNSYLMTDSTVADGGIEVQHSPNGDEVITVIARNTKHGRSLDIGSGDLIKLIQDERLRLPTRCCYRR
jgi:DNA-directed RNA polymerase specialized sigma24 family protein